MRSNWIGAALIAAGLTAGISSAAAGPMGDAARGADIYKRCGGCHSLDTSRVGPAHRTVYGRTAGTLDGYQYSAALKASGIVWNAETLDAWLTNPGKLVPGSRMGFRLSSAEDRADVIAYLRSVGPAARPAAVPQN